MSGGGNVTSLMTSAEVMTPTFAPEDLYTQLHTVLIVFIFCVVCLLLLSAFFYTLCFHCSLKTADADGRKHSLEREDATFRRSSSSLSLGNNI